MKSKRIGYWITTAMVAVPLGFSGVRYLLGDMPDVLGIPAYFWAILGTWKVLGVGVVVVPGFPLLKEWAYAGFFFTLSGAAASHLLFGDGIFLIAAPLVVLAIGTLSYLLRPPNRRLSSSLAFGS
jgi:hypothetical protein